MQTLRSIQNALYLASARVDPAAAVPAGVKRWTSDFVRIDKRFKPDSDRSLLEVLVPVAKR